MTSPGHNANIARTFSWKGLKHRLSSKSRNPVDLETANASGDGQGTSINDNMWWNASRQRIRDYISGIPTSSASEASPTIVVRRSNEKGGSGSIEILTNSAAYRKRLEKSVPELQKLVKGHGYRIRILDSR